MNRPFPANNKWLRFDFSQSIPVKKTILHEAIVVNTSNMLNAPANLLGINGIRKFANEIMKWKAFNPGKLKMAGITNYFMINADGGTGGGAFRNMYGNFLIESSSYFSDPHLAECGNNFIEIAKLWDNIGHVMMNIFKSGNSSIIDKLPVQILNIADMEEKELQKLQRIVKQ